MTEVFLHYLWQFKLFKTDILNLITGENIEIIKSGEHNPNAGPDFFNARIKIGNTIWAGNVEIHINTSDWNLHKHSSDKAYDNIILHVVYNHDETLLDKKGNVIPTLELKKLINPNTFSLYSGLKASRAKIPCEKNFKDVNDFIVNGWLERILLQRLERKTESITNNLNKTKSNWEEIFYIFLSRSLGFGINAEPMELLAKSIPLSVLNKHKSNLTQIEALLFGQSGLLENEVKDEYHNSLKKEYGFLRKKYSLNPLPAHLWKFLRLRPANFPTIRIAQLSNILFKQNNLFAKVIEANSIEQLIEMLEIGTSEYWQTHYNFKKASATKTKKLGLNGIHQIIINCIVPLVFIYGKQRDSADLCDKALGWLEQCPPEKNSIISLWETLGAQCDNAWQSQGYLELKKEYCDKKHCLKCAIGNSLLKKQ